MSTRNRQGNLFDLKKARQRRDDGMRQVVENEPPSFADCFYATIHDLPYGWVGTCEDIRQAWQGPKPHHHNVWGANWNAAKRLGLLVELPEQVHMTAVKSHARKTHLYQKVRNHHDEEF